MYVMFSRDQLEFDLPNLTVTNIWKENIFLFHKISKFQAHYGNLTSASTREVCIFDITCIFASINWMFQVNLLMTITMCFSFQVLCTCYSSSDLVNVGIFFRSLHIIADAAVMRMSVYLVTNDKNINKNFIVWS